MRKKSFWLVIGLMIATLVFAFVGCKETPVNYKMSETEISLKIGESKQLKISPTPQANVSWESDNGAVATVQDGLVFAVGTGDAVVTAKIAGVEKALECTVKVTEDQVEVEGCKLETVSVSLKSGDTFQLNVIDANNEVVQDVTWTSSDNAIATVSNSGLVTAVAAGDAMISAKLAGGTLVCKVTVTQKNEYKLDKEELDIAVGGSDTLTLITLPEGSESPRPHTFTSKDPSIATVEGGTGKVTGVGKGTTKIICSVDGEDLEADVTVREYTVKIGNEVLTSEMNLNLKGEYDVTITADPAKENITATYASSDEEVVAISDSGHIVALKADSATLTITVGGKAFTTTITVVSGYSINHEEATLTYGKTGENTVQLAVTSGGSAVDGVKYESSDTSVATVSDDGLVTAVTVGTAKITATVNEDVSFDVDITVIFGVGQSEVEYSDGQSYSVNLDTLDTTNETIDWIYYGSNNYVEHKKGGSLLDEFSGEKAPDFYDYRVGINWTDGTTTPVNTSSRTDGITLKNGSFTVKVTKDVKYISIFTGVYHGTNTTTISYNGVVCKSVTFENNGNNDKPNKNKQIIFTPDVEHLIGDEMEFTISFQVGAESSHGWVDNISLVAVVVVGNTERQGDDGPSADTIETSAVDVKAASGTYNLSEIGNEDWVLANTDGNGTMARKAGVSNVILNNEITYSDGVSKGDFMASGNFTWNSADATVPNSGTNNRFVHVPNSYTIPVHLTQGVHKVSLYLSGWKNSYFVSVLDGKANMLLNAYKLVNGDGSNSQAVAVTITINVLTEDTFNFRMSKDGDGNHGWGAIAVSQDSAFELDKTQVSLVKGSASKGSDKVTVTGSSVEFTSNNTQVATVGTDGTITAVGGGTTYITVSDGKTQERVLVTVTEYTLGHEENITLSVGATLKIDIIVTPDAAYTATYTPNEEGENNVWVDSQGVIHAVKSGTQDVTISIEPDITFTLHVTVVGYQINETSYTLHAGKDVAEEVTLEVYEESDTQKETPLSGVTWNSSNSNIAEVDETTGVVRAMGTGTATITGHLDGGATVSCTITVIIPDATEDDVTGVGESDIHTMDIFDLTRASDTYKTIDYKHWHANDPVVEMPGREALIGDASGNSWGDWGGTMAMSYGYSETKTNRNYLQNTGVSYFRVYDRGITIPITVNNKVSEIILFVGGWNTTATVTFKLGDRTFDKATVTYSAAEVPGGQGRKITFTPDTAKMLSDETLTIEIMNDGGNVSLFGIAVAGTEVYDNAIQATATATTEKLGDEQGSRKVNLTEEGTYDWLYSHYESPNNVTYRKFEGHNVFTGETYYDQAAQKKDGPGELWDGKAAFKWTDGKLTGSDAAEGTANGTDSNEGWEGKDEYTNNCFVTDGEVHIKMQLAAGKYVIKAYLYTKFGPMGTTLYDGHNNFVVGKQLIHDDHGNIEGYVVTFTIDVTEEGEFTLVVGKVRSHDGKHDGKNREIGWQAISIAQNN